MLRERWALLSWGEVFVILGSRRLLTAQLYKKGTFTTEHVGYHVNMNQTHRSVRTSCFITENSFSGWCCAVVWLLNNAHVLLLPKLQVTFPPVSTSAIICRLSSKAAMFDSTENPIFIYIFHINPWKKSLCSFQHFQGLFSEKARTLKEQKKMFWHSCKWVWHADLCNFSDHRHWQTQAQLDATNKKDSY